MLLKYVGFCIHGSHVWATITIFFVNIIAYLHTTWSLNQIRGIVLPYIYLGKKWHCPKDKSSIFCASNGYQANLEGIVTVEISKIYQHCFMKRPNIFVKSEMTNFNLSVFALLHLSLIKYKSFKNLCFSQARDKVWRQLWVKFIKYIKLYAILPQR